MTRRAELDRLFPLIEAEYRAKQGSLAELKRQEEELVQRLRDLSGRHARAEEGGTVDPARLAGADLRWQAWAESRRTEINQRIARLRVDQEWAKADLRRSFGRRNAIDELCKAARKTRPS